MARCSKVNVATGEHI